MINFINTKTKLKEYQLQKQILDYLKAHRIFHWRVNTGVAKYQYKSVERMVRFGTPGISDIIGIHQGRMFAIEVKVGNNKTTQLQELFLKNIIDNGGIALVAYSLEDVIEIFGKKMN